MAAHRAACFEILFIKRNLSAENFQSFFICVVCTHKCTHSRIRSDSSSRDIIPPLYFLNKSRYWKYMIYRRKSMPKEPKCLWCSTVWCKSFILLSVRVMRLTAIWIDASRISFICISRFFRRQPVFFYICLSRDMHHINMRCVLHAEDLHIWMFVVPANFLKPECNLGTRSHASLIITPRYKLASFSEFERTFTKRLSFVLVADTANALSGSQLFPSCFQVSYYYREKFLHIFVQSASLFLIWYTTSLIA